MQDRTFNLHAYPLAWPEGWQRTAPAQRKNAQFSKREMQYRTNYDGSQSSWSKKKYLTVSDGVGRILESLEKMGVDRNEGASLRWGMGAPSPGARCSACTRSRAAVEQRFRELARQHHPDVGGDTVRFQEIAAAREAALSEVRA